MTENELKENIEELKSLTAGMKSNPNNFPIIDKYNSKIYQKNKFQMFEIIKRAIEEELKDNIISYEDIIPCTIKD